MSLMDVADILGRISPQSPRDLDARLDAVNRRSAKAGAVLVHDTKGAMVTPLDASDAVCFALRITEKTEDPVTLAMHVAQLAAEKSAIPIVFSHVDACGLEKFGFRVERIAGRSQAERDAMEAELKAFWNVAMVI
jgi:hypothetical protein